MRSLEILTAVIGFLYLLFAVFFMCKAMKAMGEGKSAVDYWLAAIYGLLWASWALP